MATPPFKYEPMFQLGPDTTEYYLLTKDYVSVSEFEGKPILKIEKEGLTAMANAAFRDVSFMLRRSHNEQVAKILSDPEASDNDKYVALTFLRNADVASKGLLPFCQDTGTAIIHGEKGQQVWTGYCDEEALSHGVYKTYTEENLRYSQNAPLTMYDEVNTKCNLPAQIDIEATEGMEYHFLCVTKGGGSANKTYLYQETKAILNPAITMVMFGVSIAVVWIAAVSAKDISEVGNMIAFIQYAMQIIMSFMMLSMAFVLMPRAAVSAERVADVLDTPASVVTPEHPIDANVDGDIVFDDVAYSYGGDAEAVRHISFTAKKGEVTAIIGSTGSGKSTIVNLIPRMADATEGKVTIGGVDVRDFDLKKLRAGVGFVPQKNILFSGTIESNIKYSDEDMPDERMERAAEIAQATEFVASKEDGYKSEIAQGGDNVSGGQKQRIAIARALAKECPIYVFDDSFSALDFKTDAALRQALKDKLSGATIVIVAQRVGTIKNADNIIVLDDGEIVGQGTHEQLLASCPVYLDIAKSQLSEEELGL